MGKRTAGDFLKDLLSAAANEARIRGDRRIGTNHLLMALLGQAGSTAGGYLGVDKKQLIAADDSLDLQALKAVGIEVGDVDIPEIPPLKRRFPPLSSGSREVIKTAVDLARPHKTGRIASSHFLAALLSRQQPDPVAELLHALGVSRSTVLERLSASMKEETE